MKPETYILHAEPMAKEYKYRVVCHFCGIIALFETQEHAKQLFTYHQGWHHEKMPNAVEINSISQTTLAGFGEPND